MLLSNLKWTSWLHVLQAMLFVARAKEGGEREETISGQLGIAGSWGPLQVVKRCHCSTGQDSGRWDLFPHLGPGHCSLFLSVFAICGDRSLLRACHADRVNCKALLSSSSLSLPLLSSTSSSATSSSLALGYLSGSTCL